MKWLRRAWQRHGFELSLVLAIAIIIAAGVLLHAACVSDNHDYKTPAVGSTSVGTVADCQSVQGRYKPCGWVYYFPAVELEFCLIWDDRSQVLGYPVKMLNAARSLYGDCELAKDPRFNGVPLCYYQCPSAKGCNATGGCFCLEETPP